MTQQNRVALYARFSTDLQNPLSAADQLAALRKSAEQRGWLVVAEFRDEGISGSGTNRPGLQSLVQEAENRAFDIVYIEALDRLSRDLGDTANLKKRLNYYQVAIWTPGDGEITIMHAALGGLMSQQFLEELGKKTRRGLTAAVQAGRSGGGRCYGYRLTGTTGVFEIDQHQAAVIRKIFERYAARASARQIASELNAEGEPGPRGGTWTASSINGDRRTGDGILHQKLYVGVRVYNRRKYRKHPDTSRRTGTLRPREEWLEMLHPELRILEDSLWQAVQDQKEEMSVQPVHHTRRPKRLLSHLIRCAQCAGAMTLQGNRYACSAHRERGTCANSRTISADRLESRVLRGLQEHLLSPQAVAQAVEEMRTEYASHGRDKISVIAQAEKKRAIATRKIERMITAIEDGEPSTGLAARLHEREAEVAALDSEIAQAMATRPAYDFHPAAADAYRRLVENLVANLNTPAAIEARSAIRRLIGEVNFYPGDRRGEYDLEVRGVVAELFSRTTTGPKKQKTSQAETCEVILGAGAGFEPATFRL